MRWISADLTSSVVGTYDQTKTTIQGRVSSKTINSKTVLGPPLTKFHDVFTDSGITTAGPVKLTPNGRMFTINAEASGLATIVLYNYNFTTGAGTYVGKIVVNLPDTAATTTTYRSLKVIDSGTTNWKIFIVTTGSVLINGGLFLVNKIDLADFIPIGSPTIPFATGNDQKAVYFLQDPANIGVNQLNTASVGSVIQDSTNRIYVHNGTAAANQFYVYSTNTAPTYSTGAVTGVAATDVISHAGHPFIDNDPIVFTAISGGAGITVGTVYFVRNSVAGVSYQISTTSGGAVLNFTTDISSGSVGRAFGTTGSNFVHKTGTFATALTGTLLSNDSEDYASPVNCPANPALNGQQCAFFATSSNLYLGLLSELTSGATTWPSLTTSNLLGTANEIITPTASAATWSNFLDAALYVTNTAKFVIKKVQNNVIEAIFGELANEYYEGFVNDTVPIGLITIGGTDIQDGILAVTGTTAGQRGILTADLFSDASYDYSYITTKVLNKTASLLKFFTSYEELWPSTGNIQVQYRDSGFGSISGGWIDLDSFTDLSSLSCGDQVQFKILFKMQSEGSSAPAQIHDLLIGIEGLSDISDYWEFSFDDSSNGNPSINAFRLKTAYATSVPTLYFRAYDTSNSLIVNHNTASNPSFFEYSTDGGVNWSPLGTIPNTVGTLLRYTYSTPPGVDVRPGLQES